MSKQYSTWLLYFFQKKPLRKTQFPAKLEVGLPYQSHIFMDPDKTRATGASIFLPTNLDGQRIGEAVESMYLMAMTIKQSDLEEATRHRTASCTMALGFRIRVWGQVLVPGARLRV